MSKEVEKDKSKVKEKNDIDVEKQKQKDRDTWAQREIGRQRDQQCIGFIQLSTYWFPSPWKPTAFRFYDLIEFFNKFSHLPMQV